MSGGAGRRACCRAVVTAAAAAAAPGRAHPPGAEGPATWPPGHRSVGTSAIAVTFFLRFFTRKSMKKNDPFVSGGWAGSVCAGRQRGRAGS